jgi:hypothetical protein
MAALLTAGAVRTMMETGTSADLKPVLQVLDKKLMGAGSGQQERYRCVRVAPPSRALARAWTRVCARVERV